MIADRLADLGEAVEPLPWCKWAWRAWHALKSERAWRGGGMGPAVPCDIPWSSIMAYADRYGHDADLLLVLIRAMDDVFITWWCERAAAATKTGDE